MMRSEPHDSITGITKSITKSMQSSLQRPLLTSFDLEQEERLLQTKQDECFDLEKDVESIRLLTRHLHHMVHADTAEIQTLQSEIDKARVSVQQGREKIKQAEWHRQHCWPVWSTIGIGLIVIILIIYLSMY